MTGAAVAMEVRSVPQPKVETVTAKPPINVDKAIKTIDGLRAKAQKAGVEPPHLKDIRAIDTTTEDLKAHPLTRASLENAQQYATQQAREGISKLIAPGPDAKAVPTLDEAQVAKFTPEELAARAKAKGIEIQPTDSQNEEQVKKAQQDTLDYLENAQELARENTAPKEAARQQVEETASTIDAAYLEAHPDMSHDLLAVVSGGNLEKAAQHKGVNIVQKEITDANPNPDVIAFGLDMQIAGVQMELGILKTQRAHLIERGDGEMSKRVIQIRVEIQALTDRAVDLQNQRQSGNINTGKMEVQENGTGKPEIVPMGALPKENFMTSFAESLGVDAAIAAGNPLAGINATIEAGVGMSNVDTQNILLANLTKNGYPEEAVSEVKSLFKFLENKAKREKMKGTGGTIGKLLAILMMAGTYAAWQKHKAAAGQAMQG